MRVETVGEGEPELAVVGAVHGDEPCGARAIERFLSDGPAVERPVKLIIANEAALEAGVRYVDADLNRAFGPDVPEGAHERALAERLAAETEGYRVLSIHSTQSHADPFAISAGVGGVVREVVPRLPVAALVDTGASVEGRLFATEADILEVEAGLQRSEAAAENAYDVLRAFLTATGALPGDAVSRTVPIYELGEAIPKPPASEYHVYVENFRRVAAGERFAAADGEDFVASEAFWPILMSPYGYADVFGYRGQPAGEL
jgi:predicted deacylase